MSLNIKNPEAHQLAQKLAKATDTSMTQAVTEALRDALTRAQRERQGSSSLVGELDTIATHCASLPVRDGRSAEDILGYNEQGLPR